MKKPRLESGSFRDREGRVFYHEGKVYRALSARAAEAWEALSATSFFPRLMEEGKVVGTRPANLPPEQLAELSDHWTQALEHDRIPFISYPYEWSFSMLRDAAWLQLDLLLAALEEGMILKDSSAYNVQWQGAKPVFIDVASFEPLGKGEPWVGYLQFCQLFLYPLMLAAYKDLPFQPWLRGSIDGIDPADCNAIMSVRDRARSGVFTHVYLQSVLQAKNAASTKSLRQDMKKAGFPKQLIVNNVRGLRKLVDKLSWGRSTSEWGAYAEQNSYDRENHELKAEFVRRAASTQRWGSVWDMGCNTGTFSRIAAEHADTVLSLDGDHLAIDRLYLDLKEKGPGNILPLIMNLADASPSLGWRHAERQALGERPAPDLILALALVHHMVISANIPLPDFIGWLADLGGSLVIEFVSKDDPMVKKLLLNKDDIYHDYEPEVFEACLKERYEIAEQETYHQGTRTIYFARPKG